MADNSIITLYRRKTLCEITSGASSSLAPITHIAFGDGGVDGGVPIQPENTAIELNHEVARYAIDTVTFPEPTTACYVVTIPENDLEGVEITESGLIDADGGLCAIKTFYVKKKDLGLSMGYTFLDEF